MIVLLAKRAAPLLVTTMLVAVPAWAQTSAPSASSPPATAQTQPPAATTPGTPSTTAPSTMGNMQGGSMGNMSSGSKMGQGPSGTMHKGMPHSRTAAAVPADQTMQTMVENRLNDLHSRLKISAAQGQQWDQFAQVMRDNAKAMDQLYKDRADKLISMSAVDNMQSFAQIEQERAQDMQKLVPAFQTLYASLSDEQKQSADKMFRYEAQRAQTKRQTTAARHAPTKPTP